MFVCLVWFVVGLVFANHKLFMMQILFIVIK